ncbi:MAG: metallophosphoesterase family protein, partial [Bacillota bacterium]
HLPTRADRLPPDLVEAMEDSPDMVLHGGDYTSVDVLEYFQIMPHFVGVVGNMDPQTVAESLPREREIEIAGFRIGLLHGDGPGRGEDMFQNLRNWFNDVDIVISGHTHAPHLKVIDGVYLFNPGSATDPRADSFPSFGWIQLDRDRKPRFTFVAMGGEMR